MLSVLENHYQHFHDNFNSLPLPPSPCPTRGEGRGRGGGGGGEARILIPHHPTKWDGEELGEIDFFSSLDDGISIVLYI